MQPELYAKALKKLLSEGFDVNDAFANFIKVLKRRGAIGLLPKIVLQLESMEMREQAYKPTLSVARDSDFTMATKDAVVGVLPVEKVIDKTLIGGYKIEQNGTLIDTSYKGVLLDLYRKITN